MKIYNSERKRMKGRQARADRQTDRPVDTIRKREGMRKSDRVTITDRDPDRGTETSRDSLRLRERLRF